MMMQKSGLAISRSPRQALGRTAPVHAVQSRRSAVRVQAQSPMVGTAAPDFKAQAVVDQEFVELTLKKYRGKYVVLFF